MIFNSQRLAMHSKLTSVKVTGTKLLPILSHSNSAWTHKVQTFRLPPHTRLLLADVDAGSDTPSMAGKVLKWKKENEAEGLFLIQQCLTILVLISNVYVASEHWTRLNKANGQLAHLLSGLCKRSRVDEECYGKALKAIVGLPATEVTTITNSSRFADILSSGIISTKATLL